MSLVYTTVATNRFGNAKQVTGTATFDSSYPTGGEPFDVAAVGLYSLQTLEVEAGLGGYLTVWNKSVSAPKILAYQGDNTNAAAAPGIEVPNTTNLATVTVTFIATGK